MAKTGLNPEPPIALRFYTVLPETIVFHSGFGLSALSGHDLRTLPRPPEMNF